MQRIAQKLALSLLAVCLSCLFVPVALAVDGAEVELIVDYQDRHQVTVIVPEGVSPEALRDQISAIVASPLLWQHDWSGEDGMHIWLYSAPQLVAGGGWQKAELWDFTQLATAAAASGLPEGVNLFLVVNQPRGAFRYDTSVSDGGAELPPAAADGFEVWWGFGLRPGGPAPVLSVLLWLRPPINWLTLLPFWLPLGGCALLSVCIRGSSRQISARLQSVIPWALASLTVLLALWLQWPAVLAFLLGSSLGLPGLVSLFISTVLPFTWSTLWLQLPFHRRLYQERQTRWTLRRYLVDVWRQLAGFWVLALMALVWFTATAGWAGSNLWLSIVGGMLLLMLYVSLLIEGGMVLRFGRCPAGSFAAEAMLRSLSARLRIHPPPLHFITKERLPQANAFAAGLLFPRVYVSELLWDQLNQPEQQFILAHELAHIQRRDTLRLFWLFLLPVWLLASSLILLLFVAADWALAAAAGLLVLAILCTLLVTLPVRRDMEAAADLLALQATGDLDAAASALSRLCSGQRQTSRRFKEATHPNLASRLQRLRRAKGSE